MVNENNRFVFVVPVYNASKTLDQMMRSVIGQSYKNWKLILIDDVSSQSELAACDEILRRYEQLDWLTASGKLQFIKNETKRWEVANVLLGIKQCDDNDIICRLDADDYLCDLDALAFLNEAYEKTGFGAIWTAHRWNVSSRNISGPMHPGADPYKHPWVSSHLKTFRKKLINNVPFENFLNMNGDIIKRAGDRAIYLPVLLKAATARGFLNKVFYHYHIDEQDGAVYQSEDAKFQLEEALYISDRGYVSVGKKWEDQII